MEILVLTSMMRYERGNTTYIYPYTHKVGVPKFITPTPSFTVKFINFFLLLYSSQFILV